ncbi:MAG: hypothetical protein OJF49_004712 [Ktedonobacterales bacterium]|nr:MAG: hypothetical protein OJF49_004712 [Ktedonobacterales bacterium]
MRAEQLVWRGTVARQPTTPEPEMGMRRRLVGELLGTFLLVLFHAGAATGARLLDHAAHQGESPAGVVFLALVDSFSLCVILMVVGKVSGAVLNPAVTLGLASGGRFPRGHVLPYIAAQYAGAILGVAAVLVLFGHEGVTVGRLGAVRLSVGTSIWQGWAVEAVGAFILLLTISATAEDPRAPSGWAALTIAMALGAIVLCLEPATGAPVNPARAFGPDFVDALFGLRIDWLVYLVTYLTGPIVGAVAAVQVYRRFAEQPRQEPLPE